MRNKREREREGRMFGLNPVKGTSIKLFETKWKCKFIS
jgi:hypothetical protein